MSARGRASWRGTLPACPRPDRILPALPLAVRDPDPASARSWPAGSPRSSPLAGRTSSWSTSAAPPSRAWPGRASWTSGSTRRTRPTSRRSPSSCSDLGFQPQGGPAPWPRPVRWSSAASPRVTETTARARSTSTSSPTPAEWGRQIAFRDALRADPGRVAALRASSSGRSSPPGSPAASATRWPRPPSSGASSTRSARPSRRSRPARRSGSSAVASSGGCSGFAARALGYRVAILDPDPDCPARSHRRSAGRRAPTTTSRRRSSWPRAAPS